MTVTTNAADFSKQFKKYAAIYSQRSGRGKTLDQILLERAKKLAYALYEETAKIAPTKAQITADVQAQGWNIPKHFKDGRIGRGLPTDWQAQSFNDQVDARRKGKRGRKTKAEKAFESSLEGTIRSAKSTLQMMQAYVIRRRLNAAGYIASGWLGAIIDLGGGAKIKSGAVSRTRGRAEIAPDGVYLINDTPGCVEANAKYGFTGKAIAAQISDMAEYISSRLNQLRKAA